ncbi:MAG: aldo/keto reductase [Phycisphaerales bacterium]|nr:MAG: aldo/keto reductase [Phycisphaerales bacterium]
MIYQKYGNTDANVSAVGFGGMRFDESKSKAENAELLLYAHSKGINYFDTAPSYCGDTSEDIFGIALKQMADRRDDFYVSTKGMPTAIDTAGKARAAVEKSLKRLNVDKIDFYHVWCVRRIDHYESAMKSGGMYEGLLRCKEQGLIDHIAISTHLPGGQVAQIVEKREFDGVLLGVNALNFPYRWEGVQAAHAAGLGVVAMNPLSGGLIPRHEAKFGFLTDGQETATEAALRFCINCPQITVTLVGVTRKEHIDTACNVAQAAQPFTDDDLERVRTRVSDNMNALCTGCGYCLKCCPQNIPIANYMQVYNEKPLFGRSKMEMVMKIGSNYQWGLLVDRRANAGDCIECGQCEEACTQHLNIIERLKEIDAWERMLNWKLTRLAHFAFRALRKLRSRLR